MCVCTCEGEGGGVRVGGWVGGGRERTRKTERECV
jgi:hypothetical protein